MCAARCSRCWCCCCCCCSCCKRDILIHPVNSSCLFQFESRKTDNRMQQREQKLNATKTQTNKNPYRNLIVFLFSLAACSRLQCRRHNFKYHWMQWPLRVRLHRLCFAFDRSNSAKFSKTINFHLQLHGTTYYITFAMRVHLTQGFCP